MLTFALKRIAISAFVLALFAAPANAAKKPTYNQLKQQVKQLTHSRNAWRTQAGDLAAGLSTARADVDSYRKKLAASGAQVTQISTQRDVAVLSSADLAKQLTVSSAQVQSLQASVADLTGQRDRALAGLPAAISAVPLADFPRLVFAPARAAWPCDSFYQGTGYWSYTFDSPGC
jgi:septal ring factor EnvC (AmiA/AmiB activator)